MAGLPFDILTRLATQKTFVLARELLVRRKGDSKKLDTGDLDECLKKELTAARAALLHAAKESLPQYFVFSSGEVQNLLRGAEEEPLPARNNRAAGRERHLLLYLQRLAAKNDTFSEFGPSSWGAVRSEDLSIQFSSDSKMREVFLERWTAHAIAAALNADPTVRPELSPRLHPNGRVEGNTFISEESGEIILLDPATQAIVARCDGATPAHSLGVDLAQLANLAAQNILRWEAEVRALDPHAFDVLVSEITQWRDGPTRTRWLDLLQPLASLCAKFAGTKDVAVRSEIMQQARCFLDEIGVVAQSSQRFLYNAANPIGEDCSRISNFTIGERMIDEVAREAEPWIDLWRDSYAYIASRVAAGLRGLFQTALIKDGAVALPAFLRHCEAQKMPLTSHGLVALAHIAFLELKGAFQEILAKRPDAPEWALTAEECHFVRNNFEYPRFDEYTFPSADLQISAASIDHANRGEYEWMLAELHPPIAMLHHCMYWDCPDKPAFARALASTACGQPNFFYGFAPADFTAHTTVRQFDVIPELSYFVAPRPGKRSGSASPRLKPKSSSTKRTATLHYENAARVNTSAPFLATGSFRSVSIHFILDADRTCRGCAAERSSCNGNRGRSPQTNLAPVILPASRAIW